MNNQKTTKKEPFGTWLLVSEYVNKVKLYREFCYWQKRRKAGENITVAIKAEIPSCEDLLIEDLWQQLKQCKKEYNILLKKVNKST